MKSIFTLYLSLIAFTGWSQQDTGLANSAAHFTYQRYAATGSVSVGFFDSYRSKYSLPAGYQKGNTTGSAPFYAKLEYGFYKQISIGVLIGYDAFQYNFKQDFIGNNGPLTRYKTNKVRILSGGLAAFYHLNNLIHIPNLDPFAGVGLSLNNIRYNAFPQGDSTLTRFDHTVTPYIKVGARFYISDKFSLFADFGYDKQSLLSLGFSCRFFGRKKNQSR